MGVATAALEMGTEALATMAGMLARLRAFATAQSGELSAQAETRVLADFQKLQAAARAAPGALNPTVFS